MQLVEREGHRPCNEVLRFDDFMALYSHEGGGKRAREEQDSGALENVYRDGTSLAQMCAILACL
jgi:hypothetical protein